MGRDSREKVVTEKGEEEDNGALNTCVGISANQTMWEYTFLFPKGGWRFMRRVSKDEVVREKAYIQSDYPTQWA